MTNELGQRSGSLSPESSATGDRSTATELYQSTAGEQQYYLNVKPGHVNEVLDVELDQTSTAVEHLLNCGLPYQPYMERFNALQGLAENLRAIIPRPLPGETDRSRKIRLCASQVALVRKVQSAINSLKGDLARALYMHGQLSALRERVSAALKRAQPAKTPAITGASCFAHAQKAGSAQTATILLLQCECEVELAMQALRAGKHDEADVGLQSARASFRLSSTACRS